MSLQRHLHQMTCVCRTSLFFVSGHGWMRVAEDRVRWRAIEEAYVQQWTGIG